MAINREFYCSIDELEAIFDANGNDLDLKDFFLYQSNIYLTEKDYDRMEKLMREGNPIFKKILRNPTCNRYPTLSQKEHKGQPENPSAIYISSDEKLHNSGYVYLTKDNFKQEFKKLQKNFEALVFKDEEISWKDLLKKEDLPPLNSLVVVDKFIFKTSNGIGNLKSILTELISPHLKNDFHLTIIGDPGLIGNEGEDRKITKQKMKDVEKEFSEWISQCFPNVKPKISILLSDSYHNRWIVSNYFRIKSQHGFNLIKNKKIQKDSDVDISGVCLYANRYSHGKLLMEFAKIKKNLINKKDSKSQVVYGSADNRLLDCFMEYI